MEGADQVLAERRVDRRLAADGGIDLRQQAGRDLHVVDAAPQRRRGEAGEIADDAAAERDHDVAPLDARGDQRVADAREFGVGFRRLAGRADDRRRLDPGGGEAVVQRRQTSAGDVLVGDDGGARLGNSALMRSPAPAIRPSPMRMS